MNQVIGMSRYTLRCASGYETYADIKIACQECKQDEMEHRKELGLEREVEEE